MSERIETGVVQFDEDWPGVFIRGDNALGAAIELEELLDETGADNISTANLRAILECLHGCNTATGGLTRARRISLRASPPPMETAAVELEQCEDAYQIARENAPMDEPFPHRVGLASVRALFIRASTQEQAVTTTYAEMAIDRAIADWKASEESASGCAARMAEHWPTIRAALTRLRATTTARDAAKDGNDG